MRIFVDIDQTICLTPRRVNGSFNYKRSTPIAQNIQKINNLYKAGHSIIYWTARGSKRYDDKLFKLTIQQLNKWGCLYHELRMGKPDYDTLICDKAKSINEII